MPEVYYNSGNFIGRGEDATFNILKMLTGLHERGLKDFAFERDGIYRQVPLRWLIHPYDYNLLSDAHKKGSIDIFIKLGQKKIAVRVQGKGHGQGDKHHGKFSLKGTGKTKHDKVQADLIQKYCFLVDIKYEECPNIMKEKVNQLAIDEVINSFNTFKVMIPKCLCNKYE